jgi:outer membrane protein
MMKLHLFALVFTISALASSLASAQSPDDRFTLDVCYRSALKHAEKIGIAREAVALAEYTRKQALSVLMPTVTAFGNYRRYREDKYDSGSLVQPEWEGSYGVKLGQSFTLNGRELTALRIAEQGIVKSRSDLDATTEAYLYTVASAFFDVAKTQQAEDIAQANVLRLTTHKAAVTTRLRLGDVAKTELFRTEAELASAEADLIQARNNLQLARSFLGRLIGVEGDFEIVEPGEARTDLNTGDLEPLKELALTHRADLMSLELDEDIAAKQVDYTSGAFWPRLSVEGAWTRIEQDPDPMLDESAYVGASLTFDLFDGGLRRAQVSEARATQRQARLNLEDSKRTVTIEVEEAWRNWKTQQGVITSFESQLRYATENYDAFTRLFEHGMANSVDVMDANTLLVTAERKLSESRYNLQLAVLGMERSAGVFLNSIRGRLGK